MHAYLKKDREGRGYIFNWEYYQCKQQRNEATRPIDNILRYLFSFFLYLEKLIYMYVYIFSSIYYKIYSIFAE